MKIYIVCNLEGTAGVVDFKPQCMTDGEYYRQARAHEKLEPQMDLSISEFYFITF